MYSSLRVCQDQGEAEGLEGRQRPQGSRGDQIRSSSPNVVQKSEIHHLFASLIAAIHNVIIPLKCVKVIAERFVFISLKCQLQGMTQIF